MIETIIEEIKNLSFDCRAEALVAQLLEKSLDRNHVFVRTKHAARRSFSRDIYDAGQFELPNGGFALQLILSRSALYDLIPEGVFFQPPSQTQQKLSAAEMAEESRQLQKQEQSIRNFFSPLENEFFHFRLESHRKEADLLDKFEEGLLDEYLVNFWKLHPLIPAKMAIRLVLLMPFIHQIAGDVELMASSLAAIIQQPVIGSVKQDWIQDTLSDSDTLGAVYLANSSTCGRSFAEETYVYEFAISVNSKVSVQDYLEGGSLYFLIQAFYGYFVPANADFRTVLSVEPADKEWRIGEEQFQHLGITSII